MKNCHESKGAANIEIMCLGGDGGLVTGSCHTILGEKLHASVDYGMFQGRYEERSERGERRNFTPSRNFARGLTDIFITHAHIDHIGLLPKIYGDGFSPEILATETTAIFMEPMLRNSAQIQARENPQNRLYDDHDVDNTLRHVVIVKPFREINIGEKYSRTTVQFLPNGHVMGSNSILIKTQGDSGNANILFTGDMGKPHQSLCGGYLDQASQYPNDPIDVLVVESTNFLREPISFREKQANLLNEIQNVWKNGGNPLLPTLSFHRFQEIIEILHNNQGKLIPEDCKIFIDAPLGMTLLEDFKELDPDQLTRRFGDEANYYKTIEESLARFNIRNVTIINSHEDSIRNDEALANYRGKAIIIASGGMGGYGRAVNYIHGKFGQNPQNTILFTCYQVEGTEGAALVRRENASKNGRKGARVIKVEGFTSHISGPKETFAFLNRFNLGNLRTVIITHGKDEARQAMAAEFRRKEYRGEVILPVLNQRIKV